MARRPRNLDLVRLSARIEREQLAQIEAIATASHQQLSPVVRQLLQEALDARALRQQAPTRTPSPPALGADGPAMGGGK